MTIITGKDVEKVVPSQTCEIITEYSLLYGTGSSKYAYA